VSVLITCLKFSAHDQEIRARSRGTTPLLRVMNVAYSLPSSVTGISFSLLSTQDVRRISVKQIVNTVLLDDLNRPNIGGLYDPALGPSDHQDLYMFLPIACITLF
jgi:hypothetical protein